MSPFEKPVEAMPLSRTRYGKRCIVKPGSQSRGQASILSRRECHMFVDCISILGRVGCEGGSQPYFVSWLGLKISCGDHLCGCLLSLFISSCLAR